MPQLFSNRTILQGVNRVYNTFIHFSSLQYQAKASSIEPSPHAQLFQQTTIFTLLPKSATHQQQTEKLPEVVLPFRYKPLVTSDICTPHKTTHTFRCTELPPPLRDPNRKRSRGIKTKPENLSFARGKTLSYYQQDFQAVFTAKGLAWVGCSNSLWLPILPQASRMVRREHAVCAQNSPNISGAMEIAPVSGTSAGDRFERIFPPFSGLAELRSENLCVSDRSGGCDHCGRFNRG